jgi:AAA family ATP:ADP antiporter
MPLGVAARRKTTMRSHNHDEENGLRDAARKNDDPYPSSGEEEDDDDIPSTNSENSSLLDPSYLGGGRSHSSLSSRTSIFLRESLVLPLMMMYFVMLMINTILRDTKDTMLVNSVAGVAAIPILKSWITIPTSFAFFVAYSRLSHSRFSQRAQFMIIVFSFAFFYAAFAFLIYPFRKHMSPRAWGASVRDHEPHSAAATLASTVEEWTLGLFYVVSELWSSAVCQLMFWQVANDVMTIRAAKEIYPVIGAMGNAGLVVAGRLLLMFADRRDVDQARAYLRVIENHHPKNISFLDSPPKPEPEFEVQVEVSFQRVMEGMDPAETGWLGTLIGIAVLVFFGCVFIAFCYDDVYRRMRLFHPLVLQRRIENASKEKEAHSELTEDEMGTWQALRTLAKSEPLRLVAVLVASYGVSSSLIEVSWKGQVKRAFSQTGEYSRFMGSFWTWTGLSSMACMVLSSAMLQRLGYRVAVMFTPLAMMCAGGLFFAVAVSVAVSKSSEAETTTPQAPLSIAAYAGALAVLVAKSAKYAVFDATKEMVFIPLDKESRGVGKAAIDVVAYRLSKSGGAFALQIVLLIFGSLDDAGLLPIGVIFAIILFAWMRAAYATGKIVHDAQRTENQLLQAKIEEV